MTALFTHAENEQMVGQMHIANCNILIAKTYKVNFRRKYIGNRSRAISLLAILKSDRTYIDSLSYTISLGRSEQFIHANFAD